MAQSRARQQRRPSAGRGVTDGIGHLLPRRRGDQWTGYAGRGWRSAEGLFRQFVRQLGRHSATGGGRKGGEDDEKSLSRGRKRPRATGLSWLLIHPRLPFAEGYEAIWPMARLEFRPGGVAVPLSAGAVQEGSDDRMQLMSQCRRRLTGIAASMRHLLRGCL